MIQQSARFSTSHIIIVCLVALVPVTTTAIAFGPERFRTKFHAVLENTTLAGVAMAGFEHLYKICGFR